MVFLLQLSPKVGKNQSYSTNDSYSLFLDTVEARPSVTSISVHLHIENTTRSSNSCIVRGFAGPLAASLQVPLVVTRLRPRTCGCAAPLCSQGGCGLRPQWGCGCS